MNGRFSCPWEVIKPCHIMCYVCNKRYEKYFLPVIYEGVVEFLRSRRLQEALCQSITVNECDRLLDTLRKDKDWLLKIFGKITVQKYNITAFFLQMIGVRFIIFETRGDAEVVGVIAQNDEGLFHYEDKYNWEGIEFRTGKSAKRLSFRVFLDDYPNT